MGKFAGFERSEIVLWPGIKVAACVTAAKEGRGAINNDFITDLYTRFQPDWHAGCLACRRQERSEHRTERRLLGELAQAIEGYRCDPASGENLVKAALRFKSHLIGHMQQEEAILFRLAEEMLDDEIKISLIIAFAGKEAEAQGITLPWQHARIARSRLYAGTNVMEIKSANSEKVSYR